jgi:hypothetical protein
LPVLPQRKNQSDEI